MSLKEKRCGLFSYSYQVKSTGEPITADEVEFSFHKGFVDNVESNGNRGLRKPQYGALCAIRSHWTVSDEPITIVLPTGTGKTETMLAAIVSEKIKRVLVIVPNKLLRDQTYEKAKTWGILKDIGCINNNVLNPKTLCLKSNFKDIEEFKAMIDESNIIIATMSLINKMDNNQVRILSSKCNLLVVDEAHHISSRTWRAFKRLFLNKKILQFTATPYRQDGKLVDGKIIYNFPMRMAIEEEYFKPIDFIAIEEYDNDLVDNRIAERAVLELKKDLKKFNHILLVRVNTIDRAEYLFEEIYSKYSEFNPVLITSKVKASKKREGLSKIKSCESKIVVCVDMFGEGIDIPNLKIAALHDKYKSLPITLQFIGRFARSRKDLGTAKVIANIADVDIMDSLKELYEKDADWNKLLPIKSEKNIQEKLSLQELIAGFDNINSEIDLMQIRPKVSMLAYCYKNRIEWHPDEWIKVLDESSCSSYINNKEKIIVIIEPFRSYQAWTTQKNIESLNWNFYVIYWNSNKKYVCINASDHEKGKKLIKYIFNENLIPVRSEVVFRCLANVKRLVFASVGLNSAIDGPVRYKMFAGIDVAEGISESNKSNCYKSNVFGMGYEGDGRISIGCSYKGKIWSRWVENISFWQKWCDNIMEKILNDSNDSRILDNVLIPEVISEIPKDIVAYRIDFDESIFTSANNISISTLLNTHNIFDCELLMGDCIENKQFFKLVCNDEVFNYYLQIKDDNYGFVFSDSDKVEPELVKGGKPHIRLSSYFNDNPPTIWYVGTSSLQGNVMLKALSKKDSFFSDNDFIPLDWGAVNVDIQVESQLANDGSKRINSIQYAIIKFLKEKEEYSIIFDDDGSGEIADIVAIRERKNEIVVELYHCKYSSEETPGARITDLYEVCGQAEKSVFWKASGIELIERLKYREAKRLNNKNISRFELGDMEILGIIQKKMLYKQIKLEIFLVQPGVDSKKVTPDMRVVLGGTSDYCKDTFSVPVKLICS